MRYYIIINGVNSLTIPGLAIRTLPPISKPAMRNLREEIDGRDGDITTELGYGAYDRILEIGLYGDYDIDRIISFFNTKGTIIFSDEPDKYYNFEIVDKIDYTKLVKFRTASINIHCQPFKYPTEEEPEVEEYEYVEATGTNVTLDNTSEAIFNKIDLLGNTEQAQYTGKNKWNLTDTFTTPSANRWVLTDTAYTLPAGTYSISFDYTLDKNVIFNFKYADNSEHQLNIAERSYITFTEEVKKAAINIKTANNTISKIMIEAGSQATSYEPYVGGIPSPNPNYPQDIHVVSGDNEINICGKNLLYNSFNQTSANGIKCELLNFPSGTFTWSFTNQNIPGEIQVKTKVNGSYQTYANAYSTNKLTFTLNTPQDIQLESYRAGGNPLENYSNIMIERGSTPTTYEPYISNTYPIYLGVENAIPYPYNQTTTTQSGITITDVGDGSLKINGTSTATVNFNLIAYNGAFPNGTYTFELENGVSGSCYIYAGGGNSGITGQGALNKTIQVANNTLGYFIIQIPSGKTFNNLIVKPKMTTGSHLQYISTTPIELCKIGTYQDYIYKDNGSWYLHKEIGKYIFDSTWSYSSVNNTFQIPSSVVNAMVRPQYTTDLPMVYCNYLSPVTWASSWATLQSFIAVDTTQEQARVRMSLPNMSLQDFQTWLTTHEMFMLYQLINSTDIEITNETLIEQLEDIWNATSYRGQTNITQVSNDLPFMMEVSALKLGSDHLVINNSGNIYAKPTIDIEGTGVVDIYLNDVQILEADLSETNNIVIDTEAMEAYNPDTNALANRQVTGDYSKIKLEPGENDLRFSGDLSKATVTKYKRWL